MSDINILSPHVADLIAAGEVVERPASVIKELMENSFDAGAKNVTVEISDGGMTFIRVADDGCGMLPEDAGLCFTRHATSKLRDESGLAAIGTMGFRGEALAAISAVSSVELTTCRRGSSEGVLVTVEAGDIRDIVPFGCPEGATMTVRALFRNTPARLKFVKSDRAEATACENTALRCALGRPEISVRFIRDGKDSFFSPGDGKISSCIYSLLGRETAADMLKITAAEDGVSAEGYISSPRAGHGSRAKQFFFINGRSIRSALLQSALEQAYKNTLLTGRFPAAAIYLTMDPARVDVNVHPAKTEVKFRDEKLVFDTVYNACLSALTSEGESADISLSPSTARAVAPKKDFFKSMGPEEFKKTYPGTAKAAPSYTPPKAPAKDFVPSQLHLHDSVRSPYAPEKFAPAPAKKPPEAPPRAPAPTEREAVSPAPAPETDDFRLVGEVMKTYIIVERGDEMIMIDKHAAHERMIFDRLKAQGRKIMSQMLLTPVTVRLGGENTELIEKNSVLLESLGFDIEPYGDDSVILRGVPADTDETDAPAMIEEICQKLSGGKTVSDSERVDEILHSVACKAAIKAGWNTTDEELMRVAREVVSGRVRYCPHGRPVSVVMTRKQLDKEFSRIV